jgi:hypothetical protein
MATTVLSSQQPGSKAIRCASPLRRARSRLGASHSRAFPLSRFPLPLGPVRTHTRTHTGVLRPPQRCTACWIAALPVTTQCNLLQRSTACCIPAQSLIANAIRRGCRLRAAGSCGGPQSAVHSFRAPATADGVPRLLGTHACGTIVARCTLAFLPLIEQVSSTCVRCG